MLKGIRVIVNTFGVKLLRSNLNFKKIPNQIPKNKTRNFFLPKGVVPNPDPGLALR